MADTTKESSTAQPDAVQLELERHKNFLLARSALESASHKVAEQFDKAVMTLAAGGLSMSLLFIQKIAPQPKPDTLCYLTAGWIGFTASLLFVLSSFLFGYQSFRREIHILQKMYKNPDIEKMPNWWTTIALVFNWVSAAALIAGAGFIVFFAILNAPNAERSADMTKGKQQSQQVVALKNGAAPTPTSQLMFGPSVPIAVSTQASTSAQSTATNISSSSSKSDAQPAPASKK